MHSELHSLNLKLCNKQYNKTFVLHLIVAPQLSGWQHNYSTKNSQAGRTNEQSMYYSLMSLVHFPYTTNLEAVFSVVCDPSMNVL
jgi:hypothetical protein